MRRDPTAVLLNLPIDTQNTTIDTLLELLDYFDKHPDNSERSVTLTREDSYDVVCLWHMALAQDSPFPPEHYINQILNYHYADDFNPEVGP